jgi:hypothetical protein
LKLNLSHFLVVVFAFFSNLIVYGQSALTIRDGITLSVESNGLLYIQGDIGVSNSGDSSLILNSGKIELTGDFSNSGTGQLFSPRIGEIELLGTSNQKINGSSSFNELRVNNGSGVTIQSGTNSIYDALYLDLGVLTTNDSLVINSDELGTARIAEITGGSISGDIISERWIDSSHYEYRFLGSPVQGITLADWSDDMRLMGFPGSQYAWYWFNNVTLYDETVLGVSDSGYYNATDISNPITMGQGLQMFIGGDDFVIDAQGAPNTGTQEIPVTFTDDPLVDNSNDGWQIVSNPYPSGIDWLSTNWVKTNIDDAIYIWDGINKQYASFVGGVGTNSGSRYIASSQAFWIKSNGSSPKLTASEGIKVSNSPDFIESTIDNLIRVKLIGSNSVDETVLRLHANATINFDPLFDAYKLYSSNPSPQVAFNLNSEEFSILSIEDNLSYQEVELKATVQVSGNYQIQLNVDLDARFSCLILEDKITGRIENLRDSASFSFFLFDSTSSPRFTVKIGQILNFEKKDALCSGELGKLIVKNTWDSLRPSSLYLTNFNTSTIDTFLINKMIDSIPLKSGIFDIELESNYCSNQFERITINEHDILISQVDFIQDSITSNSKAWVFSSGGTSPYSYYWTKIESTLDTAFLLEPNKYLVYTTDINGCLDTTILTLNRILPVGIKENKKDKISVFPNPFDNSIQIAIEEMNIYHVQVLDINSRVLIEKNDLSNQSEIDLLDLNSGIYFLKIYIDEELIIYKIQKL